MATKSFDGGYVISDRATANRFAKGYAASINRTETLPDARELLEDGRRCLELGLLGK